MDMQRRFEGDNLQDNLPMILEGDQSPLLSPEDAGMTWRPESALAKGNSEIITALRANTALYHAKCCCSDGNPPLERRWVCASPDRCPIIEVVEGCCIFVWFFA